MSLRLEISHEVRTGFGQPASYAIRKLRMTPKTHGGQYVCDWRIDVDHDCRLDRAVDSFGNVVHTFSVDGPLDELAVTAAGVVEVDDTAGVVEPGHDRLPIGLYLRETPLTDIDPAVEALAGEVQALSASPLDRCHGLMGLLTERVARTRDGKGTLQAAAAVLGKAEGSAIDIAHVFCATARRLMMPARLVAGYMYDEDDAEADACHSWTEVFVDGLGWVGFDPPHDRCPTDAYIRVAVGLDWLDASPLRGASSGPDDGVTSSQVRVIRANR
ncbi:transglutaminase family protein [Methylobrevis albus]|uniref:Transglutaminase family protein n=1 Tax=Methylobrevis albus TaxID=2793297 RepID=A0A931I080_9HYPH|nr:transglutaminase family protein [Methylobrevis albus]MBH0236945.1 transglutaminase family protein [Methylobrevis albus]